ncbi:copper resistance protein CopC [Brachybacterium sp. SGAir0954]|uniref:copper resistance CopC family protein n=1 Tax=Brachybacterium sp. SGAir0954 TaxID=2571029 RepID=UPI0010CD200E|nr:copper resistance CopC family protein [Brachybacterium sp. SGAir0954]QCR53305.1 copper resistance protein CopC [Brachybacterium sp. SGAir0954]
MTTPVHLARPHAASPLLLRLAPLAALVAAALLLLLTAAPASAHDSLVSSDPEDGATLETSPEQVTLDYSADVLDVSPVVRITGEGGEVVAELDPEVDGSTVTAALDEPLAAGDYEVRWRVVSSDGHPIEGTQSFTVEQGAAGAPSDAGGRTSAPASDAGGATSAPAETTAPAAQTEDSEGGAPVVLIVVIVVAVLAVAGGAVAALRRKR